MTAPTLRDTLLRLLGPGLADALWDPNVTELYTVEGDSFAWLDTRDRGRIRRELALPPNRVEMVLNTVATATGVAFGPAQPLLAAEVADPFGRLMGRIQGFLPPVVTAPTLVFRKPAPHVYPLDDLVSQRFLPGSAAEALRGALLSHETILVVGGTGTGKTTFLNSLLRELAALCPEEGVAPLEDTPDLVCWSPDRIRLRTFSGTTPTLGLYALLDAALRASPHRIVVGEAWNSSDFFARVPFASTGVPRRRIFSTTARTSTPPSSVRPKGFRRAATQPRLTLLTGGLFFTQFHHFLRVRWDAPLAGTVPTNRADLEGVWPGVSLVRVEPLADGRGEMDARFLNPLRRTIEGDSRTWERTTSLPRRGLESPARWYWRPECSCCRAARAPRRATARLPISSALRATIR